MKNSQEILSSLLKTTQMGQIGIRSMLKNPIQHDLRNVLQTQLERFDEIEQEAHEIAGSRGWEVDELNPSIKLMTNMMTASRLKFSNSNSRAAEMMIRGNIRGVIKGIRNIHQYHGSDERICSLAQNLIECEQSNIRQMQGFL